MRGRPLRTEKEPILNAKILPVLQTGPRSIHGSALTPILALLLVSLSGCGDVTKPVVKQIAVTNASGVVQTPITALPHNTSINLDAAVTQDPENLGVDWTVTCSNDQPDGTLPAGTPDLSCGTFTLYHTLSAPVSGTVPSYLSTATVTQFTAPATVPKAGTVTITAHATSLPSSTASLTLPIM